MNKSTVYICTRSIVVFYMGYYNLYPEKRVPKELILQCTPNLLNNPHSQPHIPPDSAFSPPQILPRNRLRILLQPLNLLTHPLLQSLIICDDQSPNLQIQTIAALCIVAASDKGQARAFFPGQGQPKALGVVCPPAGLADCAATPFLELDTICPLGVCHSVQKPGGEMCVCGREHTGYTGGAVESIRPG